MTALAGLYYEVATVVANFEPADGALAASDRVRRRAPNGAGDREDRVRAQGFHWLEVTPSRE